MAAIEIPNPFNLRLPGPYWRGNHSRRNLLEAGRVTTDNGDAAYIRGDYRKAAEQGHAEAQFRLGAMYFSGDGVPRDDVGALKWYRLAAEQGHVEAQDDLAYMYENGLGVAKT